MKIMKLLGNIIIIIMNFVRINFIPNGRNCLSNSLLVIYTHKHALSLSLSLSLSIHLSIFISIYLIIQFYTGCS